MEEFKIKIDNTTKKRFLNDFEQSIEQVRNDLRLSHNGGSLSITRLLIEPTRNEHNPIFLQPDDDPRTKIYFQSDAFIYTFDPEGLIRKGEFYDVAIWGEVREALEINTVEVVMVILPELRTTIIDLIKKLNDRCTVEVVHSNPPELLESIRRSKKSKGRPKQELSDENRKKVHEIIKKYHETNNSIKNICELNGMPYETFNDYRKQMGLPPPSKG